MKNFLITLFLFFHQLICFSQTNSFESNNLIDKRLNKSYFIFIDNLNQQIEINDKNYQIIKIDSFNNSINFTLNDKTILINYFHCWHLKYENNPYIIILQ